MRQLRQGVHAHGWARKVAACRKQQTSGTGKLVLGRGVVVKNKQRPHERRSGWLRNGNPPGDFSAVPKCGAKTRRETPCRCPAMKNGRCRLHGGLSTGPRTAEGIARIQRAVTKHGRYTATARAERRYLRELKKRARSTLHRALRIRSKPEA